MRSQLTASMAGVGFHYLYFNRFGTWWIYHDSRTASMAGVGFHYLYFNRFGTWWVMTEGCIAGTIVDVDGE